MEYQNNNLGPKLLILTCADPDGAWGPDPGPKNHTAIGFLAILVWIH